jgi:hypothetical protein
MAQGNSRRTTTPPTGSARVLHAGLLGVRVVRGQGSVNRPLRFPDLQCGVCCANDLLRPADRLRSLPPDLVGGSPAGTPPYRTATNETKGQNAPVLS